MIKINQMTIFSETFFSEKFDFVELDLTVASSVKLAVQTPVSLYLFFQRYTYFNAYASSLIARLASSIAISRYLFKEPEMLINEQADRGMQIADKVMFAAVDEGANGISHRSLAQATLRAIGDYAGLSVEERNQYSQVPSWLDEIVNRTIQNYQGTPGDIASLIKAMGFHLASEMMGDREYTILDRIIRHENKGVGFDSYLNQTSGIQIGDHRYHPWCWVLIHSQYESSGIELLHYQSALEALNLSLRYTNKLEKEIFHWVLQGFQRFVDLQQTLFREIYRECLELSQTTKIPYVISALQLF